MQARHVPLRTSATLAAFLLIAGFGLSGAAAQSVSLTGQVASAEEGNMEGVVVSAKKAGSTMTVSVISDAEGNFSFPSRQARARSIHAENPRDRLRARRPEDRGRRRRRRAGLAQAAQDAKSRRAAVQRRVDDELPGHRRSRRRSWTAARAATPTSGSAKSTYDADEFIRCCSAWAAMRPAPRPLEPQKRKETCAADIDPERLRPRAEFLARINLSQAPQWEYPLKTLPRLKGRSTQGRDHRIRPAAATTRCRTT